MKTTRPRKIQKKLSEEELKIINEQVKRKSGAAVHYTDEEAKAIMEGKLQEHLRRQKELRRTYLGRVYRQIEINEILSQLKTKNITVQWRGIPMPKKLLMIEYNMLMNDYKELVSNENNLKLAIKNDGYSDTQIEKVMMDGEYVKDIPKPDTEIK